jgi:hypothetical protein
MSLLVSGSPDSSSLEPGARKRIQNATTCPPIRQLERQQRPLGALRVETDRRWVARVPQQPLIRIDRNDYSIDPVFAGRRVEVRASQTEITATVLDTGELAAQHTRIFAGFQTIVAPAHQSQLELQRKRRQRHQVDVQQRPLSVYDALIA